MDRRRFCKLASLTIGALGLSHLSAKAAIESTRNIRRSEKLPLLPVGCRIIVERCQCDPELQAKYLDDPEEGPCRVFRVGNKLEMRERAECPPEFCPKAWKTICDTLKENYNCAATVRNGLKFASCPDGTRPVLFRIEIN